MFATLAYTMLFLLVVVLIFAATKPDTFHVERSIVIRAAPEKIFAFINDFHLWAVWSPYDKDPAMKKTFSGSASGKGAGYAWHGNKEVGRGEIAITDATPPHKVVLDLHMIAPFEARNGVVFSLNASGDSTTVVWGMDGKQNLMVKVMGLFVSMDKMVGKDFEVGLARLKAVAEK
jgi:uncharacterized protein YndB with AHSA1/START domain